MTLNIVKRFLSPRHSTYTSRPRLNSMFNYNFLTYTLIISQRSIAYGLTVIVGTLYNRQRVRLSSVEEWQLFVSTDILGNL